MSVADVNSHHHPNKCKSIAYIYIITYHNIRTINVTSVLFGGCDLNIGWQFTISVRLSRNGQVNKKSFYTREYVTSPFKPCKFSASLLPYSNRTNETFSRNVKCRSTVWIFLM